MPTPTHRSRHLDATRLADGWLQIVSTSKKSPASARGGGGRRGLDAVLFDMDGTLIDGLSSWEMVHAHFGVSNTANWQRYVRGELTDDAFIRSDIELWRYGGREIHVDEVDHALHKDIQYMPGAREVVAELHTRGIATAIVSGGLDVLARTVAMELGIEMYVANGLRLDPEGFLRGDGLTFVKLNDKARTTRDLLGVLGVEPVRVAAVGNSAYDVGMFDEVGFSVAVNPFDDEVRNGADRVVEGKDLRDVLAHFLEYDAEHG